MSAATIDAEGLVMGFTFDYIGQNLSAATGCISAVETSALAKVSRSTSLTCLCSDIELITTALCRNLSERYFVKFLAECGRFNQVA